MKTLYHKRQVGEPIICHDGKRSVCVGILYPDGIFVKHLKTKHILRKPEAIALQAQAIAELERKGCQTIRAEVDSGKTLLTPFSAFKRHAFPVDRGFGKQLALLLSKWEDARAVQGSLFGGEV